jgi:hypothetical protein
MPKADSILIPTYHDETKELQLFEFNLDSDGKVVGRQLDRSDAYTTVTDKGLVRIREHLERFLVNRNSGFISKNDRFNSNDDSDISFSE